MKRAACMLALFVWAVSLSGQYSLSGTVVDEEDRPLPGANLVITRLDRGTVAGEGGRFSFRSLPEGEYTLRISFVGYDPVSRSIFLRSDLELGRIVLSRDRLMVEEVVVTATRAGEKTPVAFSSLDREEIAARNFGQDVPYLMLMTPSLVTTSDAGHGIGYTSMRIRGTDGSRINVTVNGIPLNDAESHLVYWVDLPDIAASVDDLQVQRGIGTSTNGAAAFGATVNLMTRRVEKEPYASYEGNAGSFRTFRNALSAGTGLMKDHFAVDLRLSDMHSDGYIDRSWTDLRSHYVSAGYHDPKTLLKFITFSGTEELYQAWNGVPSSLLDSLRTYNELGAYTDTAGKTVYYDNQVDHYRQDHYQLHFSREISGRLHASAALHYTRGSGYYEEYREDQTLSDYGMEAILPGGDTVRESDLIRRKWLQNDFYGAVGGLQFREGPLNATLGGGWNRYDGDHFGTVIWARYPGGSEIRHRWYENRGVKSDWNGYLKASLQALDELSVFLDLQVRGIRYEIEGTDDDLRDISQRHTYLFFNPKAGINFQPDSRQRVYLFVGRGNREPSRSNFVDADPEREGPVHETLMDYEAGYSFRGEGFTTEVNLYFMDYRNQLVLTGEINDVGSAVMSNVKQSHRAGIELSAGAGITPWLRWDLNTTFSTNKIRDYHGYVDNWDYWYDPESEPYQIEEELGTTDLSFSPGIILNSQLSAQPLPHLHLGFSSRFVGRQFIDNTSSPDRSLDPYFVNDLNLSYAIYPQWANELSFHLQLLNLFNHHYESNAWIYRYFSEGKEKFLDGYFPQAGFHLMAGFRARF